MTLRRSFASLGFAGAVVFSLARPAAAATPYLVKNLAAGATNSIDTNDQRTWTAAHGSTLLFAAQYGGGFINLFKSDGTSAGTVQLESVTPGGIGSTGSDYARLRNAVTVASGETVFHGRSSSGGSVGLWKTDGTATGTVRITMTSAAFGNAAAWNGKALYETSGGSLWVTDGTAMGSRLVRSFYGTSGILALDGSYALVTATEGTGYRVYRTNGILSTTLVTGSPVNAVFTGGPGAVSGGSALFMSTSGLYSTDGSNATVVSASVYNTGTYVTLGGVRYFIANGNALWRTDGTSAGTSLVRSISISGSQLVVLGSTMYFVGADDDLWKSDGTAAGTVLVKELDTIEHLTVFDGKLYFTARDSTNGTELWESDGTAAGTKVTMDIEPGSGSSSPSMFQVVGSTLFFAATDSTNGRELWAIRADPTMGGDAGTTDAAPDASSMSDTSVADSSVADSSVADSAIADGNLEDTSTADSSVTEDSSPSDTGADTTIAMDATTSPDTATSSEPPVEATPSATSDDGGCGCSVPGSTGGGPASLIGAALAVIWMRRRRTAPSRTSSLREATTREQRDR